MCDDDVILSAHSVAMLELYSMADPEILKSWGGSQCISLVVIYHKCTRRTMCLFLPLARTL